MIDKHEEAAREASAQGAQVICFQELFYGPYFCQVQDAEYYSYTEQIPDGPTTQRFQSVAKELGMVMVLPMYEIVQDGLYYNTAAVIDADGTLPRQVPQAAHPAGQGLLGEVLLHARHRRVPDLRHRRRQGRRLHLLRPPLPRGLADASASTAPRSCSTRRPPTAACPSTCGGSSSRRRRSPTCTTSGRSTGSASSRSARTTSTARATSSTRAASSSATSATPYKPELIVRDLDLDKIREVRDGWQFYRDRRPDAYDEIVAR